MPRRAEVIDLGHAMARAELPQELFSRELEESFPFLTIMQPAQEGVPAQAIEVYGLDNCRKLISLLLNACEELEGRLPPGGSK